MENERKVTEEEFLAQCREYGAALKEQAQRGNSLTVVLLGQTSDRIGRWVKGTISEVLYALLYLLHEEDMGDVKCLMRYYLNHEDEAKKWLNNSAMPEK